MLKAIKGFDAADLRVEAGAEIADDAIPETSRNYLLARGVLVVVEEPQAAAPGRKRKKGTDTPAPEPAALTAPQSEGDPE